MKVLVIGSGGREHALVWKLSQSPLVEKIYCVPGNAGIAQQAECVDIAVTDFERLLLFADKNKIDLTVVGPEEPLVKGIVDQFESQSLTIFGPSQKAAALEGSKAFAKYFMKKYNIPTARAEVFDLREGAVDYIRSCEMPVVVKADGLAAGKGVIVCKTEEEALAAVDKIMVQKAFSEAGNKVLIEEYLQGEEASVFALCDGVHYIPLVAAQDHKPIFDGDQGPNTGGMGAYAPAPVVDDEMMQRVEKEILEPTIKGMTLEDRPYRGLLYVGLMITEQGPKVLEFNCRFGDPETQVVLPLMKSDLLEALLAVCKGELANYKYEQLNKSAVCVVMASGGYPGSYEKGKEILGLDRDFGEDTIVFHAGTNWNKGKIVTNGGRVLGVTSWASDIGSAIKQTYRAVRKITFNGAYYRRDIGYRALNRVTH